MNAINGNFQVVNVFGVSDLRIYERKFVVRKVSDEDSDVSELPLKYISCAIAHELHVFRLVLNLKRFDGVACAEKVPKVLLMELVKVFVLNKKSPTAIFLSAAFEERNCSSKCASLSSKAARLRHADPDSAYERYATSAKKLRASSCA